MRITWARCGLAAGLLLSALACADPITPALSFGGNFSSDDQILSIPFILSAPGTVTLNTVSFGGGLDVDGNVISGGGFEPVLSLFEGTGAQNLIGQDTIGGTAPGGCGGRGIDAGSGYCLDAFLEQSLNAGTYLLALTESDNIANGPTFLDGFSKQGQGNFTGTEFTGTPGSFILFDGSQRSSAYLVNLTGDNLSTPTPEPFSAGLIAVGFAAAGLIRRKRKSGPETLS